MRDGSHRLLTSSLFPVVLHRSNVASSSKKKKNVEAFVYASMCGRQESHGSMDCSWEGSIDSIARASFFTGGDGSTDYHAS